MRITPHKYSNGTALGEFPSAGYFESCEMIYINIQNIVKVVPKVFNYLEFKTSVVDRTFFDHRRMFGGMTKKVIITSDIKSKAVKSGVIHMANGDKIIVNENDYCIVAKLFEEDYKNEK